MRNWLVKTSDQQFEPTKAKSLCADNLFVWTKIVHHLVEASLEDVLSGMKSNAIYLDYPLTTPALFYALNLTRHFCLLYTWSPYHLI